MKNKILILTILVCCIVCCLVGTTYCSADTYSVTYVDAATSTNIQAANINRTGYTYTATVYQVYKFYDNEVSATYELTQALTDQFQVIYENKVYTSTTIDSNGGDFATLKAISFADGARVYNSSYISTRSCCYYYADGSNYGIYASIDGNSSPIYYVKSVTENVDLSTYTVSSDTFVMLSYTAASTGGSGSVVSGGVVGSVDVGEDLNLFEKIEKWFKEDFVDFFKVDLVDFFKFDIPGFFKETIPDFFKGDFKDFFVDNYNKAIDWFKTDCKEWLERDLEITDDLSISYWLGITIIGGVVIVLIGVVCLCCSTKKVHRKSYRKSKSYKRRSYRR